MSECDLQLSDPDYIVPSFFSIYSVEWTCLSVLLWILRGQATSCSLGSSSCLLAACGDHVGQPLALPNLGEARQDPQVAPPEV